MYLLDCVNSLPVGRELFLCMNISSTINLSFKNILRAKRRSFFTMLGIIIGVMAVVLVMSTGAGAQSLIVNQLKKQGTDLVGILAGASEEDGPPASAFGIVVTTLTDDDRKALLNKNNVRHAEAAASYISGNDVLRWQSVERNVTYTGTTASYADVERTEMQSGRFFTISEEVNGAHVMVMGPSIAKEIFGNQDPVGQTVKLKGKNFTVIGVMTPVGASFFDNPDNATLIPLSVAQRDLLGVRHVSFIRVKADSEDAVPSVVEEVRQTLLERHDGEEDFSVRNIADALDVLTTVTNAMKFFLIAVSAISLFVGGVGIMNIMLIAVKEKTREIGLRKSVGAKNGDVLTQFLIESVVLTTTGGIIGCLLGIGFSFLVAVALQSQGYAYDFIVSPVSIVMAFVVSGGIGLVFGIVPARKAAALNPIEALRYE